MTTAPGKLFVIGEYAVVYGGNAVLVPVPHLARATVIEDGLNQLTIRTKTTRRTPLLEALASEPLLSAVVETLDCANELQSLSISLDTSEFYSARQKLGLGSSAALDRFGLAWGHPGQHGFENPAAMNDGRTHRSV